MYMSYTPNYAVDGDKTTVLGYVGNERCTHTSEPGEPPDNGTTNPWWAVDLQWSRPVKSVHLTNRDIVGKSLFY